MDRKLITDTHRDTTRTTIRRMLKNILAVIAAFWGRISIFLLEFFNPDPAVRASWRYQVRRMVDIYQIYRLIYRISALGASISVIAGIWDVEHDDSHLYGGIFVFLSLVCISAYRLSVAMSGDYGNVLRQITQRHNEGAAPVVEHPLYDAEVALQRLLCRRCVRALAVLLTMGMVLAIVVAPLIVEHEWFSSYPEVQRYATMVVEQVNTWLNAIKNHL